MIPITSTMFCNDGPRYAATVIARTSAGNVSRTSTKRIKIVSIQRSEEHTSELQSQSNLVCRLLLEKKKTEPSTRVYYARLNSRAHYRCPQIYVGCPFAAVPRSA